MRLLSTVASVFLTALVLGIGGQTVRAQSARDGSEPRISGVRPAEGLTTPGMEVIISGIGFAPGLRIYFDGLEAREMEVISPYTVRATTPYLRPGLHEIELRFDTKIIRSDVLFEALPSSVDDVIDRATGADNKNHPADAIATLSKIAESYSDYQVRAFASYEIGQLYLAQGDYLRWGASTAGIFLDADKSGPSVQTFWRYRLADAESNYLLQPEPSPGFDLRNADVVVQFDVTDNSEVRFFRSLLNLRKGNLIKAKTDSDYILRQQPHNLSYLALSAYVNGVIADNANALDVSPFTDSIDDARAAALLAEASYRLGKAAAGNHWSALAAHLDPSIAQRTFLAGQKHFKAGDQVAARALLNECVHMSPDGEAGVSAARLLSLMQ